MPWRGPDVPGAFPTLGYEVADFIEDACVIPDGDHVREPFLLTDEMLRYLLWHYRIDPKAKRDRNGRWVLPFVYFRGTQLVRSQKWGKGPLSAAMTCAEAEGPVLFDGWDANGEPVGKPWATPWIQITAVSEDQTDNIWRALLPMIELGNLSTMIPDTGETRINLTGGGRIEPVTAAARSRLGQRITFAPQDQTESWTKSNGGRDLADNQRRNLAGMGGRWMSTANAWDPAENSVAQQTANEKAPGVYLDDVNVGPGSIRNKRERRRLLKKAYGDSWWVDLDRIEGEVIALLEHDPPQAERWFLNRKQSSSGTAFDVEVWKKLANTEHKVPAGAVITIGVDGARFNDALAIVATEVRTGHQWPLHIFEVPDNAPDDYEHPFEDVDGVMIEAFERFDVWRCYIDPQKIEALEDRWKGRWGEKRVIAWFTSRARQIAWAVRNYLTAVTAGDLSHDGDIVMTRHIGNAHRDKLNVYDDEHRQMFTLAKDRPGSPNKIDGAMAGVISWEARGDCIAAGGLKKRSKTLVTR